MKEITVFEMEQVSGAGLIEMLNGTQGVIEGIVDTVLGGILSTAATAAWGSVIGGYYGGAAGGGMLGFGVIGTGVSFFAGLILGAAVGALNGIYHGMSAANNIFEIMLSDFTSGSWVA
ncbi:hypothetical protein [Atlantibacter sp.]|uniref:hypothetical protein n=1 Tax=Atlantibacter sp. TaxID=1903473 RepID=UPI00289F7867|nr:hypothetical protein [Atlantibacter sp.]